MITFAIPFDGDTACLEKTLASVLGQTKSAWKLIVCDDGNAPVTKPQVESLTDSRVRYVKNPHRLGRLANANQCFDLAETELVTLLRAGDLLLPHYASHMESVLADSKSAVLGICQTTLINAQGKPVWPLSGFFRKLFRPLFNGPRALKGKAATQSLRESRWVPTACFRKSVLGNYRFSISKNEEELWTRLLHAGHTFIWSPEVAYAARQAPKEAIAPHSTPALPSLIRRALGTLTSKRWA